MIGSDGKESMPVDIATVVSILIILLTLGVQTAFLKVVGAVGDLGGSIGGWGETFRPGEEHVLPSLILGGFLIWVLANLWPQKATSKPAITATAK